MSLKELREKRNKLVVEMRALNEKAEKEARGLTADESQNWDNMDEEIRSVDASIERESRLEQLGAPKPSDKRAAFAANAGDDNPQGHEDLTEGTVFRDFLRNGVAGLSPEQRDYMAKRRSGIDTRAFTSGTANTGAVTVPADFLNKLEIALKAYGGMMESSEIIKTDTGAVLPMPTFNYTAVAATIVGEGAASTTDASTPFGVKNLGAYTYRSTILPVSNEFLQDSSFGEGYIIDALSDSIGRGLNAHATTGTGTGQPSGIVTGAVSGKVGLTGQTTTVLADDLIDLSHSVDPAYRLGAKYMMNDQTLKAVRKLKDAQGRFIFIPGYDGLGGAMGDKLLGFDVVINQDMAQMAANAKSILFGRLDKYKLRIVRDITVLRLQERYADLGQVAFMLFMRADGALLDAGTGPVKFYQNSAT